VIGLLTSRAMTRYWLTFPQLDTPHPINLGCGVTGRDYDDALLLIRASFSDLRLWPPRTVTENIDVSTLDAGHVLPNLGNVFERGVWWPRPAWAPVQKSRFSHHAEPIAVGVGKHDVVGPFRITPAHTLCA
jgi:hypothetical protein